MRLAWVKGEAGKHVAAIWWQLMGDAEAELAYDVQLRPRIEGKAGEWEHAAETKHRKVKVDGLKAGTVYDVRVRAWYKKTRDCGRLESSFLQRRAGRPMVAMMCRKAMAKMKTPARSLRGSRRVRQTKLRRSVGVCSASLIEK